MNRLGLENGDFKNICNLYNFSVEDITVPLPIFINFQFIIDNKNDTVTRNAEMQLHI